GSGTYIVRTPSKPWGPGATWNSTGLGTQWGGNGGGNGGAPNSAPFGVSTSNRDVELNIDVLNVVSPWVGDPAATKGFLLEPTAQQNTKPVFWPGADPRRPVLLVDYHTARTPSIGFAQIKCAAPGLNDGVGQVVVHNSNDDDVALV